MKALKYFSCLLILTSLLACKKEIPLPDIASDPVTVVNCNFTAGSTMQVHLSESCHISKLNCLDNAILDATVVLKDNSGATISNLNHQSNGVYEAVDADLIAGATYQLEVSQPAQANMLIKSTNTIPKPFSASIISVDERLVGIEPCRSFIVEIEDDPAIENYYLLYGTFDLEDHEHDYYEIDEINGYVLPHFRHYTSDFNADNEAMYSKFDIIEYGLSHVFLTDKAFNGQTYQTEISISDPDIFRRGIQATKANIHVRSVSKEMYDYYQSLENFKLTQGNIFSEPELILSNIENGIGIFGAYTENSYEEELPPSEYQLPNVFTIEDGCNAPCKVKFSHDGGSKLAYSWDFGNEMTSTEIFPEFTFNQPGEYPVFLEISLNSFGSGEVSGFELWVNIN